MELEKHRSLTPSAWDGLREDQEQWHSGIFETGPPRAPLLPTWEKLLRANLMSDYEFNSLSDLSDSEDEEEEANDDVADSGDD